MDVGERRVLWSRARLQSACGQAGSHWRCFIKYAFSTLRVAPCRGLSADPWHTYETNSVKRQTKTQNARLLYYVAEIIKGHKKIIFPISRRLKAISWSIVKIRQELVPFKYLHVLRWSVRYSDYTDSRSNYSALKQSALRLSSSRLANWRTKSYKFTNNKRYISTIDEALLQRLAFLDKFHCFIRSPMYHRKGLLYFRVNIRYLILRTENWSQTGRSTKCKYTTSRSTRES